MSNNVSINGGMSHFCFSLSNRCMLHVTLDSYRSAETDSDKDLYGNLDFIKVQLVEDCECRFFCASQFKCILTFNRLNTCAPQ